MAELTAQLGPFNEDGSAEYFARIEGAGAAAITQASVTTITGYARPTNGGAQTWTDTIDKSTTVSDSLLTGNGWTVDTTGYNLRYMLPASAFPNPGVEMAVNFKFEMEDGSTLWAKCKGQVEPTLGD